MRKDWSEEAKSRQKKHPRKVNMFEDKRSENGYFLDLRGATRSKNLCLADD